MSTYIDSRTNPSNSNSFLYQSLPPSSPVASNNSSAQIQQQQTQQQQQQQQQQHQQQHSDIEDSIYFTNDHGIAVDYLVSPKPSTSRVLQSNNSDSLLLVENSSNNSSANTANKRRTSACSNSSTTSTNSLTLKPMKLANDINNSKDHKLIRDSFQLKPAATTATSSNNNSSNTTGTTNITTPSSPPSLAITPKSTLRYSQRKSNKSYKREKLKEAKNEYEERMEEYFRQLTVGCQQKDCRNKFCASGRVNYCGIMSLQPQAALIMSIQLASMPGSSRLCNILHKNSNQTDEQQQQQQQQQRKTSTVHTVTYTQEQSKPFLQSLFTSSPFSGLLQHQQQQQQQQDGSNTNMKGSCSKIARSRHVPVANVSNANHKSHWSTNFWKIFNHLSRNTNDEYDAYEDDGDEDVDESSRPDHSRKHTVKAAYNGHNSDDSYYQIDHDGSDSSINDDSCSSSQSGGMLLAIPPVSVNLDLAVEHLHRAIVTQSTSEEKMDKWCRSVFQSWEGVGNSFLCTSTGFSLLPLPQNIVYINLEELTRFYQLVIHQEKHIRKPVSNDKRPKNPRQIRIMEAISDSFETLLDRMALNVESLTEIEVMEEAESFHIRMMIEWSRSMMAVIQWIICCKEKKHKEEQDGLAALVAKLDDISTSQKRAASIASTSQIILTQKLIQVLSKIAQKNKSIIRKIMHNMLSSLGPARMEYIIQDLHQYLLDHFHTGPYKHGLDDTVIMTLKCLELIYQSNMKIPSAPVLSPSAFYSPEICKKLNVKNEYRIWKRVLLYGEGRHSTLINRQGETEHQRRSRLFMTTTSTSTLLPYPFENEYQFSWFSYPFLLPPAMKRKIVLMDAMSQMSLEYEDACVNHTLVVHAQKLLSEAPRMLKNLETNLRSATCPYLLLEIRREHFIMDTLNQMSCKWSDLKKPLKVKFIQGGEEGMDQGGVQKEFFSVLFEKLVSAEVGLFSQDENTRLCWIRPVLDPDVRIYEMVGVMMGLSIYNGVIMNLQFPKVLWKVLVMPNEALIEAMVERHQLFTLEDLEEGWPELSSGLHQLLTWEDGEVEDVFCRDYEISMDIFGQGVVTISLMPNKKDPVVPVTNDNREAYVRDYCTFFMYTAQKDQILALRRGIWSVIGSRALSLCTADELEMVACGLRQGPGAMELNMAELESVTEYDDGYNVDHPTIRQFWSVVHHDLNNDQKKQLLLFVTASDRIPVGGLKELSFFIQRNGPDSDRLPTALTCFSRLLLPEYASRHKLRDRLVTAIENTKGFGLV